MRNLRKLLALLLTAAMLLSFASLAFAAGTPETPFDDSRFFTTGDYTLHYRLFRAENEKDRVLLIHGFALSSYCFEGLAKALQADGYTAVIVDLPDFGYSTRETASTNTQPREDLMHALMQSLGGGKWVVGGHSMGGYVAIAVAQKYPDDVSNLMLFGTSGNDGAPKAAQAMMTNPASVKLLGKMMTLFSRMKPLVQLLLIAATGDLMFSLRYDLTKITDPYKIEGTGEGVVRNFAQIPKTDYEGFRTLAPVFYLNAENDRVIQKSAIEKLRGYLPAGSTDLTLPDGGHLFIESRLTETARLTLAFLNAR